MKGRRSVSFLGVVAAAAPLAVSAPDSSVTSFRIAGGKGSYGYITRGCSGEILTAEKRELENFGAELSHKFTAPVRVGGRVGVVRPPGAEGEARYVNPYLSFDWPGFSAGLGWLRSDRRLPDGGSEDYLDLPYSTVSGHVRIGKRVYWSVSYLEDVPIATGSYAQMGVGGHGGRVHIWGGAGVVPHDGVGLVAKTDVRVWSGLSIGAIGRFGKSGGITETGLALALSYAWVHRSDPGPETLRVREEPAAPADSVEGDTKPAD